MKSILKRAISFTLVLCMCFSMLALTACNKDENKGKSGITRAAWIELLGAANGTVDAESLTPYFTDVSTSTDAFETIQACVEWEILSSGGKFNPDDAATMEFVALTCMKTIGKDDLNKSNLGVKVESDEDLINLFNDKVHTIKSNDATVDALTAELILGEFVKFSNGLTYAPVAEVSYKEAVNTEIAPEEVAVLSENTSTVFDTSSLKVGDIIIANPSPENPTGKALKVESINGNAVTYSTPAIQEICDGIKLQGTFEANVLNVVKAEGTDIIGTSFNSDGSLEVEFSNSMFNGKKPKTSSLASIKGDSTTITKDPFSATFTVSDIVVTPDIDLTWYGGVKSAKCSATMYTSIEGKLEGSAATEKIKLFTLQCQLGTTPFAAEIAVYAQAGVDGELSLTYTTTFTATAEYKKGAKPRMALNADNSLEIEGHVTAFVNAQPTLSLICFGENIINVSATVGTNAFAKLYGDLLETKEPICVNALFYISLSLGVNQQGSWTSSLLHCNKTIWDSNNSGFRKEFHYEFDQGTLAWSKTDECTRGNEDEIPAEEFDTESDVVEEYFEDFVPIEDGGTLSLAERSFNLETGDSENIQVTSYPEGYSADDLVYTSADTSIATVNDSGTVSAVNSGSTTIKVSTKDGKYSTTITVTVETEYAEFVEL